MRSRSAADPGAGGHVPGVECAVTVMSAGATWARTSSTGATMPVRKGPNSAKRAEPSSKRMV